MNESSDSLTFEQALERLEAVVRDLESTETGLDKSLERYGEGVAMLKRCRAILDAAERKIRLLTGVDAAGNPITQEFDETAAERTDPGAKREPAETPHRTSGHGSRRPSDRSEARELPF